MKKIILIVVIVIVVIVAAGLFFFSRGQQPASVPTAATSTSGSGSNVPWGPIFAMPTSTEITLGTPHGSVTVKNFYAASLGAEDQFIILASNSNYEITYDTNANAFYLYIAQAPLAANRAQAETDFLARLGVNNADACKLVVAEGYPSGASLVGLGSTLSFCAPGAFGQ